MALNVVLCGVIVLCAILVVYPYAIFPWVLSRLAPRPLAERKPGAALTYALMFCAYNEEKSLPATIANLRKIKAIWPELEIFAYSDCSADRTYALLAEAGDVLTAVEGTTRAGKPAGMRKLVAMSQADVAIFMDANVIVDAATIRRFEDYFSRPDVGAVAGTLHYINEDDSAAANVGGLYWKLEERTKRLETRTGSTMGADGSLFAMRRQFYPFVRNDHQDDFLASMEILFHGLRCISAPDILAYERAAVASSSEFRRKRRIACGAFSSHREIWRRRARLSRLDRFKYVSHKLIRWFGAGFLAIAYLAAIALAARLGLGWWMVAATAVAVLGTIIALRLDIGPVRKVYEIIAAMVATFIGVLESVFGAQYATWNPVDR